MGKPDYLIIFLVVVFVIFGLLMLSSASAPYSLSKFDDNYHYVKKQFFPGLILGIFLFWIFSRLDYRILKKYSNHIFAAAIILLLLCFVPGLGTTQGKGAHSWLNVFGFSLQPSEIAKLALIIFLAAWLEYRLVVKRFSDSSTLIKFLAILGTVVLLVLLQPDLGTASIIAFAGLLVYFAAGAPLIYFPVFGAAAAAGIYILIKIAPYRAARLTAFFNPSIDPQGIGYHINQALLAIGSGRFLGVGFGQSRQKFQYLPEVSADSIFAIIGEELGFLFCALFVAALVIFFIRGLKIASAAPDFFGKILATGIVGWLVFQAFINIASMLSLMPMTGVPLPFVSYGGTALMTTLAGCGILVNISKWS